MGGAPAIYLDNWNEIIKRLPAYAVFHSDFLLTEHKYARATLELLALQPNCLFAVDVKGTDPENYLANTRRPFNADLFWYNFTLLRETGVNFYVTFTAPNPDTYKSFVMEMTDRLGSCVMDDAFTINLIDYDAAPYVDIKPAGATA